jgi:Tfp pilus assembly protein PilE
MKNKGLGVVGLLIIVALVGGIYYGWQFGYQKVVNWVNQRQAISFMKEDVAYMDSFYKQHGRYVNDDGNWPLLPKASLKNSDSSIVYEISFAEHSDILSQDYSRYSLIAVPAAVANQPQGENICMSQDGAVKYTKLSNCD